MFRNKAYEYPKLDAGIAMQASYVRFIGLECYLSRWTGRDTAFSGQDASDLGYGASQPDAVEFSGSRVGVQFINCYFRDLFGGFYLNNASSNLLTYGNIVLNVGWQSDTDRGHGHSSYMQASYSTIQADVYANAFDIGVQAYSGASGYAQTNTFDGLILFGAGDPAGESDTQFLLGVADGTTNNVIRDCVLWGPTAKTAKYGLDPGFLHDGNNPVYNTLIAGNYHAHLQVMGGVDNVNPTITNNTWVNCNVSGITQGSYPERVGLERFAAEHQHGVRCSAPGSQARFLCYGMPASGELGIFDRESSKSSVFDRASRTCQDAKLLGAGGTWHVRSFQPVAPPGHRQDQ